MSRQSGSNFIVAPANAEKHGLEPQALAAVSKYARFLLRLAPAVQFNVPRAQPSYIRCIRYHRQLAGSSVQRHSVAFFTNKGILPSDFKRFANNSISSLQRHLNLDLLIEDSHGKLVDTQLGIVYPCAIVQ